MTARTQTYRTGIAGRHARQEALRPAYAGMHRKTPPLAKAAELSAHARPMHPARICLSILLAALLVLIQPALPGAVRLTSTQATEAQALEGTSNYSDIFDIGNKKGSPGTINGSTLRSASTCNVGDYMYWASEKVWVSSAAFVSKKPVSLLHDWVIKYDINKTGIDRMDHSKHENFRYRIAFGLTKNNDPTSLNGRGFYTINRWFDSTGHEETLICDRVFDGEKITSNNIIHTPSSCPNFSSATITYSHSQNTLTYQWGSYSYSINSARSQFPTTVYVAMFSEMIWGNKNGSTTPPTNAYIDLTFRSMSMPHLEPEIREPLVYPENGTTPYGKDDMLPDGSAVRVECTVRNKYASPGSEQYPVYLKTVNDAAHPTQGIAPLINPSHPLRVKQGSSVIAMYTSANADTVAGANGTPITLVGSNEYTVVYYATINQGSGEAVRLSQCLGENSFHGTYYETVELFAEKALVEGPDASAGANYSRVPAANANGWNTTPVDIEFYAGDVFDEFDIKDGSGGLVKTLTAGDPRWGVSGDTDGVPLTYQGRNTGIGIRSTAKADVIRIDSLAPALAYDRVRNELVASDAAEEADGADSEDAPREASHATSGIWKIIRAEKQDLSSCAASDGRVYEASGGKWSATETFVPVPGTYVAVDAAGNVSAPVEVASMGLPSVARPGSGSGSDGSGDDGSGDGDTYAGPVFTGALPAGEVTVDGNGLNHGFIQEGVFEVVDDSMEKGDLPFGGTLDTNAAKQLIDNNYSFTSQVSDDSPIEVKVELVNARTGAPVSSVDTSKTGEYIVRATATDAQGNTVTVEVACRFANKDDLPQVTPKPGTPNPDDIFGELIVDGDGSDDAQAPLEAKDVKLDEATGKVTGTANATLYVPRSDTVAAPDDVATLISNRYSIDSPIGGGSDSTVKRGEVVLKDSKGNPVDGIDLSKTGTWIAEQTFIDGFGNTTTLRVAITNKKGGSSGSANQPTDTDAPSIDITPTTDVRLDPEAVGTVKNEPYFEYDADRPLNILDAIQVRPEDAEDWSAITGGSGDGSNGDGSGSGDGNGGAGDSDGNGNGSGSDGTAPQLPDDVKVTVTDETGAQVDGTDIKDPGTYTVTVSVKDPDSGEYIVVETLTFHIVDTSITDTDYIYKDVAKDHWGHGYIFDIGPVVINGAFNPSDVALGYMAGYAGTTDFGPSNSIIRGDAAIVVWRMAGCPELEGDDKQDSQQLLSLANTHYTGFTDCDADPTAYYNKAIRWCAANGIVTGYEGTGEYRPQNHITREEFASIIARYAAFKGTDIALAANADLTQYPDHECISDWAIDNIKYVTLNGIMTGKGTDEGTAEGTHGILDPQASITRAEVAKMTYVEQPSKL